MRNNCSGIYESTFIPIVNHTANLTNMVTANRLHRPHFLNDMWNYSLPQLGVQIICKLGMRHFWNDLPHQMRASCNPQWAERITFCEQGSSLLCEQDLAGRKHWMHSSGRGPCWPGLSPAGYDDLHQERDLLAGLAWSMGQLWIQKHSCAWGATSRCGKKAGWNWFRIFSWTQKEDWSDHFSRAKLSKYPENCSGHVKNKLNKIMNLRTLNPTQDKETG